MDGQIQMDGAKVKQIHCLNHNPALLLMDILRDLEIAIPTVLLNLMEHLNQTASLTQLVHLNQPVHHNPAEIHLPLHIHHPLHLQTVFQMD